MRTKAATNTRWALLPLALAMSGIACGSSGKGSSPSGAAGAACSSDSQCISGVCMDGQCNGNGSGAPAGSECTADAQCASGRCRSGLCELGRGLADGMSCVVPAECSAGVCLEGVCGLVGSADRQGVVGASDAVTTSGPQFAGVGDGYRPLAPGCGPDTANQCTGECERAGGDSSTEVVRAPATLCFSGEQDLTPEDPSAVIEQVVERVRGQEYVHLRITFDPAFTDNTYGTGVCCGWPAEGEKKTHTFKNLVGSDHTELLLTDGNSNTVMHFKIDLISESDESACGYETLGVLDGDGEMIVGDSAHVLATATSLSRNLNGCGYCTEAACEGDCTLNSPATDDHYTPNPETPHWDFRQVYEVWVDTAAFGASGFGQAFITNTHSSPAKGDSTIEVEPAPCPPDWDSPYCPPGTPGCSEEGTPPSGGEDDAECPPNQQLYDTGTGTICTPIPFANYPGMAACPEGYVLDVASEGRYCLPAEQ